MARARSGLEQGTAGGTGTTERMGRAGGGKERVLASSQAGKVPSAPGYLQQDQDAGVGNVLQGAERWLGWCPDHVRAPAAAPGSPRHNKSRGCQHGAASRDLQAAQPQLQQRAPLPSPLRTAPLALLAVLLIVISPASWAQGGGAGWVRCVPSRSTPRQLGRAPCPGPAALTAGLRGARPHRSGGPAASPRCQEGQKSH